MNKMLFGTQVLCAHTYMDIRSNMDERIAGVIKREDIRFVGVYKIFMYIFYPIIKQPIEPTSSFKCYDVLQSPRTALVYPLGSRCSPWWAWARRRAHEVGTVGRYLKGPFPLGSVLCTYEWPLEIQYNTIQYVHGCMKVYESAKPWPINT